MRNPATQTRARCLAVMIPNPDLSNIPVSRTRTFQFGSGASQPLSATRSAAFITGAGGQTGSVGREDRQRPDAERELGGVQRRQVWHARGLDLQNGGGGWDHPIHIHFEEGQILARNGSAANVPAWEKAARMCIVCVRAAALPSPCSSAIGAACSWSTAITQCTRTMPCSVRWEIDDGGAPFLRPLPTPIPAPTGVTSTPDESSDCVLKLYRIHTCTTRAAADSNQDAGRPAIPDQRSSHVRRTVHAGFATHRHSSYYCFILHLVQAHRPRRPLTMPAGAQTIFPM